MHQQNACCLAEIYIARTHFTEYEACPESKDTSHVGRQGNFYAYYSNTAVELDPLPVSRARLIVVEPALFE